MERGQRRTHGPSDGRGRDGDCACGNSLHAELHGAEPGKRPRSRGGFSVRGTKFSPIAAAVPATFEWSARRGDGFAFNRQRRSDRKGYCKPRFRRASRRSGGAIEQQQPKRGKCTGNGDDPGRLC